MTDISKILTPKQREAVTYTEGPLLVIAGAGSGKTRVLTYRVAYLVKKGITSPRTIVAVTFTRKAAREMRERLSFCPIVPMISSSAHFIPFATVSSAPRPTSWATS